MYMYVCVIYEGWGIEIVHCLLIMQYVAHSVHKEIAAVAKISRPFQLQCVYVLNSHIVHHCQDPSSLHSHKQVGSLWPCTTLYMVTWTVMLQA